MNSFLFLVSYSQRKPLSIALCLGQGSILGYNNYNMGIKKNICLSGENITRYWSNRIEHKNTNAVNC